MFRPGRGIVDVAIGHSCGAIVVCPVSLNQSVFHLGFFPLLILGDTFNSHSCAGLDTHTPIVTPTTCSTKVFIRNVGVAIASPTHTLSCGDSIFPDPAVSVFIGS